MKFIDFLPELLVLSMATDAAFSQNINNHRDSRQSSGINQRPQVLQPSNSGFIISRAQIPSTISSGKPQSSRNVAGNFNPSNEDKLTSADTSFGLDYQNQPIQGRFFSTSGTNFWNNNNRGWGWNNNNNNQWNGGYWNNNNGWNQGSVVGQKPGSCGRPVPYNSFNQNLNSGYYFDRSDDDESKTVQIVDTKAIPPKSKRNVHAAESKVDKDSESKKIVKRGYSSGPTPYYQGGSFGAGVGYLSGYSLPGYNNNRYQYNNQYLGGGGYHGGNSGGYYGGGFHGSNGIGSGWNSNTGRYCYRDYDCPGNKKCCGGICTTPVYFG